MTRAGTVWINGRLERADAALLSVTDRGFQLGDAVFETIRVVGGHALELPAHLSRLRESARVLEIPLPDDLGPRLAKAISDLCEANGLDESGTRLAVRITASRGPVDERGLRPPENVEPSLVVQAWRVAATPPELLDEGLHMIISSVRRDAGSPLAGVKTTSRAELVYAQLEARNHGADDALLLTTEGYLAESTSASLFLVGDAGLATPSLDCGILASTTRAWVIASGAPQLGLAVRQEHLLRDDLFAANEAFVASSVAGIVPVTRVDGRPIGRAAPGARTMQLRALRESVALPAP